MTKWHGGFWNEERVEQLRALVEEGVSYSQIARTMGCATRNQPLCKANRLGLVHPHGLETGVKRPKGTIKRLAGNDPKGVRYHALDKIESKPQEPMLLEGHVVTLLDLSSSMCSYPIGDPGSSEFHYCAQPKRIGSAYCEPHHVACYQPKTPYKRKVEHAGKQR